MSQGGEGGSKTKGEGKREKRKKSSRKVKQSFPGRLRWREREIERDGRWK